MVRAKAFKSELNALLDKYSFEFEGYAESNYDTNSASAAVYVKELGLPEDFLEKD